MKKQAAKQTANNNNPPNFVLAPKELLLDPNLTALDIRINLYLKWRQGRNSESWPSLELIGKEVGVSEDTVRRSIERQEKRGWLKVVRPSKQGRGMFNRYTVITPKKKGSTDETLPDKKGSSPATLSGEKGSTGATGRVAKLGHNYIQGTKEGCSNSDELRLSQLLLDKILERKGNFTGGQKSRREGTVRRWAVDIERLVRIDKRTPEQVEAVICWCQKDDFWQRQVLSGKNLRKHIDKLEDAMRASNSKTPTTAPVNRGADGLTAIERHEAQSERNQRNGKC